MDRARTVLGVLVALLAFGLVGTPSFAQSRCAAAQWKTSGKLASDLAKCESKAAKKGDAVDVACTDKSGARYAKGMSKADNKGDCVVTADVDAIEERTERFAVDVSRRLDPQPEACCSFPAGCAMVLDPEACQDVGGTLGAEGSSCDANGCSAPATAPAIACCEPLSILALGTCQVGDLPPAFCTAFGGIWVPNAVCDVVGTCQQVP